MTVNDLHLLVVEDDDFQRQLVINMLRSLGATSISESGNGRQALDIVRGAGTKPVDVTICDLNMPEMDGMEFLRHLAQEGHQIGIILTSALDGKLLSSVGKMAKMYGLKLLGTIEKPIVLHRLKELLAKHHLAENKWQRPADAKSFSLSEIQKGIQANQFEPFFQPKVNLKTGRLVGAEALARWIHPEHGVIDPYAFIPQLEQSGNIDDLTFLILEKSATACRWFIDKCQPLSISVNLSLLSLDQAGLAEKIAQVVRNAGVEAEYITFEITESAAMTGVARALENLARLCVKGFALSIDDYGTGYSSMQQLTRIAFSELKIDQSFVKDCTDNLAMSIVVESSIDMAHKLSIKCVAEGVETQQDWDALKTMGADTVQGYLIAKPMDLNAFRGFVETYNQRPDVLSPSVPRNQTEKNILVVEDDDFTRKLVVSVLHNLGFARITDADNAELAIKLFESNTFDLVITDVNMPGMNGLEVIKMIRAGRTLAKRDTRIVVLTAFSQMEVLGAALALDINGFLVKPITPAMIDEKLAKGLSEKLSLRPPFAYEAVRTKFKGLPDAELRSPCSKRGASIPLPTRAEPGSSGGWSEHHISLQRLRPGMILKEDLYLLDGTLLLSAEHTFTELSINRLYDLRSLLKENHICAQEAPKTGLP